jgi:hypothetical protein
MTFKFEITWYGSHRPETPINLYADIYFSGTVKMELCLHTDL